jgi:hypothetical protein
MLNFMQLKAKLAFKKQCSVYFGTDPDADPAPQIRTFD